MSEWNDPFAAELSPTEQEMLGLGQTVTYRYRCSRCRHEDDVPDVVIDGFAASGGCRPGQMPRLVCRNCGGPFRAVGRGGPRAARYLEDQLRAVEGDGDILPVLQIE